MNQFDHNKIIRGSFGKVWLNDERLANVKSFEAKATMDYEDVDVNGDLGQKHRYMGYSVAGTLTLHKYDSTVAKLLKDAIVSGVMTEKQAASKKPTRRRWTGSKLIALGVLFVDGSSTYIVLYLCWLSIKMQFTGSLPYLTTLIGALQVATGYVLGHYFMKGCSVDDFRSALRVSADYGGSVYYDFDSALPLPLLAGLVGAGWDGGDLSARRVLLQAKGSTVQLFLWDGGSACFVCTTALTAESLREMVTEYQLGSAWFAFDQPENCSHESAEDYLESILILRGRLGSVRSIDIVNELGYSKPSVSIAMGLL